MSSHSLLQRAVRSPSRTRSRGRTPRNPRFGTEVKHLKRSERVDEPVVAETLRGVREQLAGCLADAGLRRFAPAVLHIGLAAVFHGRELAGCKAVEPGRDAGGHAD